MNIAYVTSEFMTSRERGGLATYIDSISKMLADRGHKIFIITLGEQIEEIDYYKNIKVYTCSDNTDHLNTDIPGIIYREQARELNKRLKRVIDQGESIDIVQYSNWRAVGLNRLRIPTVVRISSDLPLWRAASNYNFDFNKDYGCTKITDYLEDIALMNADGVFAPSKLMADIIGKRCGKGIKVIESPFKMVDSCKEKINLPIDGEFIFTFGTLKLMKGIRLIGECIEEILGENATITYVFAGSNSEWIDEGGMKVDSISYLRGKAGKYNNRVIYLGKLSRQEISHLAEHATICLLPSRIDNLPNTCIEAMASGGIVIGTQGASFEQLIEDQVNGFLIGRNSKSQLIGKVNSVLRMDKDIIIRIRDKARERIREKNMETVYEKHIEYYQDIIEKKNRFIRDEDYYQSIIDIYNEKMGYNDDFLLGGTEYDR